MGLLSNVLFILGDGDVLLITIVLVFLIFISMPYGCPASLHATAFVNRLGKNTKGLCHQHIVNC